MPKPTILYTGKGDAGFTSLLGDERVAKYDLRPEAYGTVDEASAFMGLVRADPTVSERTKAHKRWNRLDPSVSDPEGQLPDIDRIDDVRRPQRASRAVQPD